LAPPRRFLEEEYMKSAKPLVFVPAVVLGAALFFACSGQRDSGPARSEADPGGKVNYPLKTDVKLTYWVPLAQNIAANFPNMGQTPYGAAIQERTGIKVEYLHPAGNTAEQFNLIIASGDLPDIMESNWLTYRGGPESAIAEGVILRLNDIAQKSAPNLFEYLGGHPDIDRMIRTDQGSYYCFPFVRGDFGLLLSSGLMIRQDWLDELGLQVPETIDEWHTVLTAFKDRKGSAAPFTNYNFANVPFAYAWGVTPRNFVMGDDGKIKYSPIEDGYRDYLSTFAQWYKEGLVDPDILTTTFDQVGSKITRGMSGAAVAALGSGMGTWTGAARSQTPSFKLTGAPLPVLRKGEKPVLSYAVYPYSGQTSAAITTKAKNAEIAARFLDWSYSEEGYIFNNFGIEGESFVWENGYPAYTDIVLKNPKGWPIAQGIAAYARSQDSGPFVQDLRYLEQYYNLQEQKDALKLWPFPDMLKRIVPPLTPTPDESSEFASIMSEVNTYQREMEAKFIIGTEPVSKWETYVRTIKNMGIDRAIKIQNAALNRYNAR
jgi:putative aldouronate transport system substrate-binding protein